MTNHSAESDSALFLYKEKGRKQNAQRFLRRALSISSSLLENYCFEFDLRLYIPQPINASATMISTIHNHV